jgi:LmbE family N-acetylglucosaminyl deacetylase
VNDLRLFINGPPTTSGPSTKAGGSTAVLGTILSVWAHPDDETYLSAGLMALARRAGNRVTCVTATRGEHGTDDPGRWPPSRLARTRDLEARAAMAILWVEDHRCLGFEDGTLAQVPAAHGTGIVLALIDELRPDTIVTFGPDGMTGHPDHRAVAGWAAAAWEACPHVRLLRATTTARFADEFADVHDAVAVFGPGLPLRTPDHEVDVAVRLGGDVLDTKVAALRAQATQVAPLVAAMGEQRYAAWVREEAFTQARPAFTPDLQDLTTSSPRTAAGVRSESWS